MIHHTEAYSRLKIQAEELFNFAVVVCYAVPSLKAQVSAIKQGKIGPNLPKPDYFEDDKTPPEGIQQRTANYKLSLAHYTIISSFSFFEAYIKGVVRELIKFHGGDERFIANAERGAKKFLFSDISDIREHKHKLQELPKKGKGDKYVKHSKELLNAGYRFPSQLLSPYGVRAIIKTLKNLRSADIPELLMDGFYFSLDKEGFDKIRQYRNNIAHGDKDKVKDISLKDAIEFNTELRNIATRFDQHLVEHFFIIEEFI